MYMYPSPEDCCCLFLSVKSTYQNAMDRSGMSNQIVNEIVFAFLPPITIYEPIDKGSLAEPN